MQNKFFHHIRLKKLLNNSHEVLLGISAGSMNMAEIVYAQPELEGEAIAQDYRRFLPGLGVTKTMIILHYRLIKNELADNMKLFEEITYPDSMGKSFIALVDGSYIEIVDQIESLYGESYLIENGNLIKLNEESSVMQLR